MGWWYFLSACKRKRTFERKLSRTQCPRPKILRHFWLPFSKRNKKQQNLNLWNHPCPSKNFKKKTGRRYFLYKFVAFDALKNFSLSPWKMFDTGADFSTCWIKIWKALSYVMCVCVLKPYGEEVIGQIGWSVEDYSTSDLFLLVSHMQYFTQPVFHC